MARIENHAIQHVEEDLITTEKLDSGDKADIYVRTMLTLCNFRL